MDIFETAYIGGIKLKNRIIRSATIIKEEKNMSIEKKVMEIILENSEKKIAITKESDLKEELGIDSFGYLMIVNALEDEFDIHIDEIEFQYLRTVSEIIDELLSRYPEIGKNQNE